jgi:hypothetical protein
MFVNGSGWNQLSLYSTFVRYFLPSFGSFGQADSEEHMFLEIDQSQIRIAFAGYVC